MSKKEDRAQTIDEIMEELSERVKDAPDPTPEELAVLSEWTDRHLEFLSDMEDAVGVAGVMTILSRVITTLAVLQGVSLERFQLGMSLAYTFVKDIQEGKDNPTQSHLVH